MHALTHGRALHAHSLCLFCMQSNYENKRIEIVNSYKYLGILLTPCLKWSLATSTLAQQATRALTMINIYDRKCGNLTFDVAIEIFDKTIVPILTYGAEIWVCRFQKVIEKVHANFYGNIWVWGLVHRLQQLWEKLAGDQSQLFTI